MDLDVEYVRVRVHIKQCNANPNQKWPFFGDNNSSKKSSKILFNHNKNNQLYDNSREKPDDEGIILCISNVYGTSPIT